MELVVHRTCVLSNQKRKEKCGQQEYKKISAKISFSLLHVYMIAHADALNGLTAPLNEKRIPVVLRSIEGKAKASARRVERMIASRVTSQSTWQYLTGQVNDKVLFGRRESIQHWN